MNVRIPRHIADILAKSMEQDASTASMMERAAGDYRTLAKENHPDVGGSEEIMSDINRQYDMRRSFYGSRRGTGDSEPDTVRQETPPESPSAPMTPEEDAALRQAAAAAEKTPEPETDVPPVAPVQTAAVEANESEKTEKAPSPVPVQTETAPSVPVQTAEERARTVSELSGTFGKKGASSFVSVAGESQGDLSDTFRDFARLYNLGQKADAREISRMTGSQIESTLPETASLNTAQRFAAFVSGMNDAQNAMEERPVPESAPSPVASAPKQEYNGSRKTAAAEISTAFGRLLHKASSTASFTDNGRSYVTNGYLIMSVSDSALEKFRGEYKNSGMYKDLSGSEQASRLLNDVYDVRPDQLYSAERDGNKFVFFESDGQQYVYNASYFRTLNGSSFFASRKSGVLRAEDARGNEVGYLFPVRFKTPFSVEKSEPLAHRNAGAKAAPAASVTRPIPAQNQESAQKPAAQAEQNQEKPAAPEKSAQNAHPAESKVSSAPQRALSDAILRSVEKGIEFNSARLFEMADKAFGGTMAEGAYTVKDAYDGMELAVNRYLLNLPSAQAANTAQVSKVKAFVSEMQELLSKLPTQTKRTQEMEDFQQYSTPPSIAYLAAWAANITPSDTVLEPSAGIGGLALWGKAWGASVYANELSKRRLAFLSELGLDGTFNFNAEQIDNLLPDRVKPTVVVMNPPFSATAGRLSSNKTANAKRHIEQALDRLEDGGRLVAILGSGMNNDSPSFRSWWDELRTRYGVRANIGIDGENYRKYGTTFDIQLVVIDKTGPSMTKTVTGTFKNLEDIPAALEGIRNERKAVVRNGDAVASGTGRGNADVGRTAAEGRASGDSSGALAEHTGSQSGAVAADRNGRKPYHGVVGRPEGDRAPAQKRAEGTDRSGLVGSDAGPRVSLDGRARSAADDGAARVEENPDSVYAVYAPSKVHIKGAQKHPAKLVESAAMSAVAPPDPTYTPSLPESIAKRGILSDAQLENIIYAGQAHAQTLPDGTRKGFFIGDGTGVGKGRQIAGIIMDNFLQGRKKALWVSKNAPLINDARRDWKDLGGNPDDIFDASKPAYIKTGLPQGNGIAFTAYSTLGHSADERLKMLTEWLGKDFDGVIALDEAHEMNNSISVNKGRGRSKPSQKALAGIALQKAFPNARIVYASATGATDITQYGYLERLGLWGRGTAFANLNDFVSKIGSGGLAAMELVARDMKAMGSYMARSISYDDVKYDTLEHTLTPMQTEIYNTMSRAWQKVLQNVNRALEITGGNKSGMARSAAYSALFSAQQRFYNQILTSMSMPSVIADMEKELANGRSCVLQLTSTNEAQANRAISKNAEEGGDLDDLDLTPSETLKQLLEKSFPTTLYEEYADENGNIRSRPVLDGDGNEVQDKNAVRMRDALIEELGQMKVPDGPLEMLFDAFGADQVAEVTGRSRRVVQKRDAHGNMKRVIEKRSKLSGIADADMFQNGKKRILVFSQAGGTGRSYHADLRAKNQQQRVHYLLQAGWSASDAVQGFGRTHRSNQASAPVVRLITTNVMGQKRFTSTIARRLDQLGALTKGQRQAGSGVFGEKDNLENPIAQDALETYYKNADVKLLEKLGLYDKLYDREGKLNQGSEALRKVSTFLNRILSLEIDEQNEVSSEFYDTFSRMMDAAIANGTVDMGLENFKADKIEVIDEKVVRKDQSGADTKYVQMKTYRKPDLIAYDKLRDLHADFRGLYKLDDGDVRAVYQIADKTDPRTGEIVSQYRLDSPVRGKSSVFVEKTLQAKASPIDKSEWREAWKLETAKAPEYVESTLHLLSGTLLPIWDRLPQDNTRVMRVLSSDGRQFLGRVIRPDQIDGVLRQLGANRTQHHYSAQEIMDSVLSQGKDAVLRDNRLRVVRRRVSGEWRMELLGNNVWYIARQYTGMITEKINYDYRYFIPSGERGTRILDALIKDNPVVDVRDAGGEESEQLRDVEPDRAADTFSEDQRSYVKALEAWDRKDHGGYFRLGKTPPVLQQVGIPDANIYFDQSKAVLSLEHDEVTMLILKNIPLVLNNPVVISESYDQTALLFGDLYDAEGRPIVVALRIKSTARGNSVEVVNKIRSVGIRNHNIDKLLEEHSIVFLDNKNRTDTWFQALGRSTPFGGTKYGPIRMLSFSEGNVKADKSPDVQAHPERWTAKRVGSADTVPMPVSEIIARISKDFGFHVTRGHVRGKGLRGQFNTRDKGIRTKVSNDLPTVCHELGHALDDRFSILSAGITKDMDNELSLALGDLASGYSAKERPGEGLAEFLRQFLQNRDAANANYPHFTKHFLESLDGKTLAMVEQLADDVNAYYALDADSAVSSIRLREEGGPDLRTMGERISDMGDDFYQAWVDANHGIKLFDDATGSSVYKLATNSAYSDAIAGRIIIGDLSGPDGQYVGPGLRAALHGINTRDKTEYKLFGEYLIVRHGPEYLNEGKRVFADDRKNTSAWMERRQMELEQEYPQFREASERLYQFISDLNETWGVGTQLIPADQLKEWKQRWPNYVPFNRSLSKEGRPGAKRGYANQKSPYRRAKGSGLDFVHPVDNIIDNIVLLVNAGSRNNVMFALREAALSNGADASLMEKVPELLVPKSFDLSGVKTSLGRSVRESDLGEADKIAVDKIISGISDVMTQFGRGKAHGDVVTVMVNGTPEFWKINDRRLLESITSMSPPKLHGLLEGYAKTTRFLTANITGNNPVWSIFSNAPRDLGTFAVYTKDRRPFKTLAAIGSTYLNSFNERFRQGKGVDPLYHEYLAMGGGHTSAYSADADLARKARKKLTMTKAQTVLDTVNPFNWVMFISDTIEMGPRFATYKLMRSAGLTAQEAFYEAMDVTTNFRRSGFMSRDVNKVVPFFNASMQGVDKFARFFSAEDARPGERGKTARNRFVAFFTASAILAAIMYAINGRDPEREKEYQQLSSYTKNSYWCIPLGDGKYFTIPKPRELAVLTSFLETCMEQFVGGNEHAFDEFYDYATENFLPSVASDLAQLPSNIAKSGLSQGTKDTFFGMIGSAGLIGIGAYMMANRDFLGKPIESAAMRYLEPRDRFNSSTSKMAYLIGQGFNLSPVMVDYFANQVLGYIWKVPRALFPVGEAPDYTLGVKSTYVRDNAYSQDIVNWLYDHSDRSAMAKKSNDTDMDKAITAKLDANMTSFYGNFNSLNKGQTDTNERRHTRQVVLDMISEYRKASESGSTTKVQNEVYDVVRDTGETAYMPSVMNTYIKDGDGVTHTLTDAQYVDYQTGYLNGYWQYIEQNIISGMDIRKKAAIITAAKDVAKEESANAMLGKLGVRKTDYASDYSGVDAKDVVQFKAEIDLANDDGSLKQNEVIGILRLMVSDGLSYDDAYTLFHSRYESDKNNPWAN